MENEIRYLGVLALAIALLLAIVIAGSMFIEGRVCETADDCEGRSHILCVGGWECINNQCNWNCEEEPVNDTEPPFPPEYGCSSDSDCVTGGCSGQLCIPKSEAEQGGGITTCEWRDEYGCLKEYASCECINGKCEWSKSDGYQACIDNISDPNEMRIPQNE